MIPPSYALFFSTMSAVGATLFGLIFVAVSIAPESVASANAPLERQAKASAAYIALLNPLIISLFALLPGQQIGIVALAVSAFGFLNTLALALTVLQNSSRKNNPRLRNALFTFSAFILYGYEIYVAIRLLQSPGDVLELFGLSNFLIILSIYGISRAWELIGVRQFRIKNWIASLASKDETENETNSGPSEATEDFKRADR